MSRTARRAAGAASVQRGPMGSDEEAHEMEQLLDFVRHWEQHLETFATTQGPWVYAVLFAIIFVETGVVIMPFLPGDSLLFAAGALAVREDMSLSVWLIFLLLTVAAVLGDAANYHIGQYLGPRVFRGEATTGLARLLNRKHLDKAHAFYDKYGGKAVVLGRFVPIVRTFVPFVAGAGAMNYSKFVFYNVAGAVLWVGVCLGAGALFGNIPIVKKNFELVVLGLIFVSLLPIVFEFIAARKKAVPVVAPLGATQSAAESEVAP